MNLLKCLFRSSDHVFPAGRHCRNAWNVLFGDLSQCMNASNFKRPSVLRIQDDQVTILQKYLVQNRPLTFSEWKALRTNILSSSRNMNEVNVDATIIGHCIPDGLLAMAKSYCAFLSSESKELNIAILARLLRTYCAAHKLQELDQVDQQEVARICDTIIDRYPILDATTSEHIIEALCITPKWMEAVNLLDTIRLTCLPSNSSYSGIVSVSFLNKNYELGWKILNKMLGESRLPRCEVWKSWLQSGQLLSETERKEHFLRMLRFIESNELMISREVAMELKKCFKQLGARVAVTTISGDQCGACKNKMKPVSITKEDFARLRNEFLDRVLVRSNVFIKSTPVELNNFKIFVENSKAFDIVIDGLNVGFSAGVKKPPIVFAKLLAAVVRYFVERNRRVLVIGRRHMTRWPRKYMDYVRNASTLFLADNLSQDDPLLLYATLVSGPKADFCSRDFMRSHSYLLGPDLKPLFRRWQQQHQHMFVHADDDITIIKDPIKFTVSCHEHNRRWHVPFVEEPHQHSPTVFEIPKSWLCIDLNG